MLKQIMDRKSFCLALAMVWSVLGHDVAQQQRHVRRGSGRQLQRAEPPVLRVALAIPLRIADEHHAVVGRGEARREGLALAGGDEAAEEAELRAQDRRQVLAVRGDRELASALDCLRISAKRKETKN